LISEIIISYLDHAYYLNKLILLATSIGSNRPPGFVPFNKASSRTFEATTLDSLNQALDNPYPYPFGADTDSRVGRAYPDQHQHQHQYQLHNQNRDRDSPFPPLLTNAGVANLPVFIPRLSAAGSASVSGSVPGNFSTTFGLSSALSSGSGLGSGSTQRGGSRKGIKICSKHHSDSHFLCGTRWYDMKPIEPSIPHRACGLI